uniref:hypothetical protein n=1 Tax=Vibrio cholerae TaxID=666 RepID=UPI003F754018
QSLRIYSAKHIAVSLGSENNIELPTKPERNAKGIDNHNLLIFLWIKHNARLRGWQRITLNSNTTAVTTAAHWDWKRRALTVPLEAFVILTAHCFL